MATQGQSHLNWPIRATFAGLWAERICRAFWPLWTVLALVLGVLMLGIQDDLPLEAVWVGAVLAVLGTAYGLYYAYRHFRKPIYEEAVERVDTHLPGRPIAALADSQAIGAGDSASEAVWQAHIRRMAERTKEAKAVPGDLRISDRDVYGLRFMALLMLVVGVLFGSLFRVSSVADALPVTDGTGQIATGPVWEGWIEPPAYTGKPVLYMADLAAGDIEVPEQSTVTLRFYGEPGEVVVTESVSGQADDASPAAEGEEAQIDSVQAFVVTQDGRITVDGQAWRVSVIEDAAPTVEILTEELEIDAFGEMTQPFSASDDYGVVVGTARVVLNMDAIDRTYGLAIEPESTEPLLLDLPMPFSGNRADFTEALIEDLSEHGYANLPVILTFEVADALDQTGQSEPVEMILPGRRFFEPTARAVIELRRDLLWSRENAPRVLQIMRAVGNRPQDIFTNEAAYPRYRFIMNRLDEALQSDGGLTDEIRTELVDAMWELALQLEEGSLTDARERLERAQERLSEAMRNGASPEEIEELMQELREAEQDYLRMLAERSQPRDGDGTDQPQTGQNDPNTITADELQALRDRIQELMDEGRMAEAMELLEQYNELMQNLQVTENQNGEGGPQTPGDEAMEGLGETLREQQGLSDEAFRDLQEQFNPDANQGESQQNEGRDGNQGQGQSHTPGQQGQQQQGQQGSQGNQGNPSGQQDPNGQGGQEGQGLDESLADRQGALRRQLENLRDNLPLGGGEASDTAREALDRAGEAMDQAEEELRDGDLAGAIDRQSEAMDALREGMRALSEALAQNEEQQDGQGDQAGDFRADEAETLDPLGRRPGNQGQLSTDEELADGEDVYRRAGEILDEIRRRSSEQDRPEAELDYLRRLLDRF